MKILFLLLFLIAPQVQSVELLVKAQDFWQRDKPIPTGTTQDTLSYLRDMWHQTHRGEIIVIKPNGWVWGGKENPPSFVVIKIPTITVSQATKYTQGLIDSTLFDGTRSEQPDTVDVKERRYYIPKRVVDSAIVLWEDSNFVVADESIIRQYNLGDIKQRIRDRKRQ